MLVKERGSRQTFRLDPTRLDDKEDVAYVLELMIAIESAAARLAALRRTPEDLKNIKRALIGMEYAIVHDQLGDRSEEHTSELQSLMRISYAVFCLNKTKSHTTDIKPHQRI